MQMQLGTSTGEDILCAEHQTGLLLPTCFVHYVSVGHFLVYMCHVKADRYKKMRNRKKLQVWYNGARLLAHVGLPHVSVFHKAACGEHCIMMVCIHFTISQYSICNQVMTHIDWNFVIGYPITENYGRTFYLQTRPHLLVTVLLIPATVIIWGRITLKLKQISKHGSP